MRVWLQNMKHENQLLTQSTVDLLPTVVLFNLHELFVSHRGQKRRTTEQKIWFIFIFIPSFLILILNVEKQMSESRNETKNKFALLSKMQAHKTSNTRTLKLLQTLSVFEVVVTSQDVTWTNQTVAEGTFKWCSRGAFRCRRWSQSRHGVTFLS